MFKIIYSVFLFITGIIMQFSAFAADIPSKNLGEQAMITSLRTSIETNDTLKDQNIVLGAGASGCEAFKTPAPKGTINILMTWQWLDAMKELAEGTIIVMPEHAIDDNFKTIKNKVHLIKIDGVLHTRTLENIQKENDEAIARKTDLIVMLAGDTEHKNGKWVRYTPHMAADFVNLLPQNKNILFLNGPRTGKYIEKEGILIVDDKAHREKIDIVTQYVMETVGKKPWHVIDFKFGTPSLWGAALKFCLNNPKTVLILPGESTSMISEALGAGIRPVIYKHLAMTKTSEKYISSLIKRKKAYIYPEIPVNGAILQEPIEPQEKVVIRSLVKLLTSNKS